MIQIQKNLKIQIQDIKYTVKKKETIFKMTQKLKKKKTHRSTNDEPASLGNRRARRERTGNDGKGRGFADAIER